MTNYAKLDHKNRRIVMDKAFAKNADIVGTAEYNQLQACRRDYPTYSVVRREIKKNPNQEHYKGLTYDFMRWYIQKVEGENAPAVLETFERLIEVSKCHSIGRRYPVIKARFLACYPEITNMVVFTTEKQRQLLEVDFLEKRSATESEEVFDFDEAS